ncbi:hypothetical protein Hhis01_02672 [Haloarcula hispanica]
MIAVYRHDVYKLTGQPHADALDTYAGVPVNQPVPLGADRDAAALSRPDGSPTQTVVNHMTLSRLSLLTGVPVEQAPPHDESVLAPLVTEDDPEVMHQRWLETDVAATVNESVYYPYTSLKYHTLLTAALLDNYRDGHDFADLHLVVDQDGRRVPHRTVYADVDFALHLDGGTHDKPSIRLGDRPRRSWAATWSRLPAHPLATDSEAYDRVLDANLRRITAWSTALQYLEDFMTGVER